MKPEKIVETEILAQCWQHGFDMTVVDSKNNFSAKTKRYTARSTSEAVSDLYGNYGPIAVYIELKARGKRSDYNKPKNYKQRHFIERKIDSGAFACVVDSFELFYNTWLRWMAEDDVLLKKKILRDALPKRKLF